MSVEQVMIQNQLAYMDSLSRANAAGHKVDNELKEVVQQLKVSVGIVSYEEAFNKAVKADSKTIGMSIAIQFLKQLQEENLISFLEAKIADDRLWELIRGN